MNKDFKQKKDIISNIKINPYLAKKTFGKKQSYEKFNTNKNLDEKNLIYGLSSVSSKYIAKKIIKFIFK